MSQKFVNSNFQLKVKPRNYNELMANSINLSSNNDLFIKNQLVKSALKFGGPINHDLIIHQKKNIRKSMGYKPPQVKILLDNISFEKDKTENNSQNIEKEQLKEEKQNILSNIPEGHSINIKKIEKDFINTAYKDYNNGNKIDFGIFYSSRKKNNIDESKYGIKSEKKLFDYENFFQNKKITEEKREELNENKKDLIPENFMNDKELNIRGKDSQKKIISNESDKNPFLPKETQNNSQNKIMNPFLPINKNPFTNNKDDEKNNNPVENPFKAISKAKLENPFQNFNQFQANNFSNNNINNNLINPFRANNNIDNPFISSNKNPFISTNNNPFISPNQNPFISTNNNPFKPSNANPFISSNKNPSISLAKGSSLSFNNSSTNNFTNKNNPFIQCTNNNNQFANNNSNCVNPFINTNNNPFTNPFNSLQFNNQGLNNTNNNEEKQNEEEDNINAEEEVKIEKDENKLKSFKEVKYEKINKFYEVEIQNLQYLGIENDKKKFISLGTGILTFQKEESNGKKTGILVLRDISTKNIKIQGIIVDSSDVEKMTLKSGLEFIMIKMILATYTKYNKDNIIKETKLTNFRIKVEEDELETFLRKTKEFFELMKK